jgi:hypothetical protein
MVMRFDRRGSAWLAQAALSEASAWGGNALKYKSNAPFSAHSRPSLAVPAAQWLFVF